MTTLANLTIICGNCGTANNTAVVISTNSFGSLDLDLRPPPMERDTLAHEIQHCITCGYCSRDLEDQIAPADSLKSMTYRSILDNTGLPELARKFAAFGHLSEQASDPHNAAWASLRAAWTCDDTLGFEESARQMRCTVLRLIQQIHELQQTFADDHDTDSILELDLLRRSGQLDEVRIRSEQLSHTDLPEILRRICTFETVLAAQGDTACYQVDEALLPEG